VEEFECGVQLDEVSGGIFYDQELSFRRAAGRERGREKEKEEEEEEKGKGSGEYQKREKLLTRIPAEIEFKIPTDNKEALPFCEKVCRTPIPIPIPIGVMKVNARAMTRARALEIHEQTAIRAPRLLNVSVEVYKVWSSTCGKIN
jgi:hypothetical protein